MPPQAMIRCECAFTYMNAVSGKNLTALFASMELDASVTQDSGGALRNVTDEARFRRTIATCIWGVSDPRKPSRDRDRGVAEGVAHAPDDRFTAVDGRAHRDAGGTKRRQFHASEVADYQEHRGTAPCEAGRVAVSWTDEIRDERRGTTPPRSVVPPIFLRFRDSGSARRGEITRNLTPSHEPRRWPPRHV
jgi:hypothetical protein